MVVPARCGIMCYGHMKTADRFVVTVSSDDSKHIRPTTKMADIEYPWLFSDDDIGDEQVWSLVQLCINSINKLDVFRHGFGPH